MRSRQLFTRMATHSLRRALTSLRRPAIARLPLFRPAPLSSPPHTTLVTYRGLCSKPKWDASSAVHGRPKELDEEAEGSGFGEAAAESKGTTASKTAEAQKLPPPPPPRLPGGLFSGQDKADMLQFQVYVRQRLAEIQTRMPQAPSLRERAELAFLEDQVVQDGMPRQKRRLRDPLLNVPEGEITYTNLPLLSRFVSEAGAILPRALTGVSPSKQRRITQALKRAHQLALLPRTWKLPKYRHASYADQYSKPELRTEDRSDDEFRDPPDIRYPGRFEKTRGALDIDLSNLSRASPGMPKSEARPLGAAPGRK